MKNRQNPNINKYNSCFLHNPCISPPLLFLMKSSREYTSTFCSLLQLVIGMYVCIYVGIYVRIFPISKPSVFLRDGQFPHCGFWYFLKVKGATVPGCVCCTACNQCKKGRRPANYIYDQHLLLIIH